MSVYIKWKKKPGASETRSGRAVWTRSHCERREALAMVEKFDHVEEHLEEFVENIWQLGIS